MAQISPPSHRRFGRDRRSTIVEEMTTDNAHATGDDVTYGDLNKVDELTDCNSYKFAIFIPKIYSKNETEKCYD